MFLKRGGGIFLSGKILETLFVFFSWRMFCFWREHLWSASWKRWNIGCFVLLNWFLYGMPFWIAHTDLTPLVVFVNCSKISDVCLMNAWKVLSYRKPSALSDKVSTRSWYVLRWCPTAGLTNGCMISEPWSKKKRAWRHDSQGLPLGVTHACCASCHSLRFLWPNCVWSLWSESESESDVSKTNTFAWQERSTTHDCGRKAWGCDSHAAIMIWWSIFPSQAN